MWRRKYDRSDPFYFCWISTKSLDWRRTLPMIFRSWFSPPPLSTYSEWFYSMNGYNHPLICGRLWWDSITIWFRGSWWNCSLIWSVWVIVRQQGWDVFVDRADSFGQWSWKYFFDGVKFSHFFKTLFFFGIFVSFGPVGMRCLRW